MDEPKILLCGGTGALGGAIACRLADRKVPFRALVRPATDPGRLLDLAAEIVRGDLREPASLAPAVAGIRTIVSSANAIGRLLAGAHDITIRDVDDLGYANLIAAAEAAGVERFVYVSALGDHRAMHTPFTDAKAVTEERLRASKLREVIVRPDAFQEVWLGPTGGFDVPHGKVTIYGKGEARHGLVATEDVAEAIVRLALADDPPKVVELAGPERLSPAEAVHGFEAALGHPLRTTHVPRIAMRLGRVLVRPFKPEIASVMGMALVSDLADTSIDDAGFRSLGIAARPASAFVAEVASRG